MVDNPSKMPDKVKIDKISEPFVRASILVQVSILARLWNCAKKRGVYQTTEYIDETRVNIHYELPLAEIVYDF